MNNSPFKKSIDDIKKMQKVMQDCNIDELTESKGCTNKGPDCKRPHKNPPGDSVNGGENEANENAGYNAGMVLFNNISDAVIKIFETPEVIKGLDKVRDEMNVPECSIKSLVEVMAVCTVNAAYEAVLFYDDLLKKELTKQFDHMVKQINLGNSEIEAHRSVLEIHRNKINEISNSIKLNSLKSKNNI